jgi:hypothetical protein
MRAYCRNKCGLAFVCAALFLFAGCANQANNSHQPADFSDSAGADIANLPGNVIEGSKESLDGVFEISGYLLELAKANTADWPKRIIEDSKESFLRADNLSILLLAGGASVAMHNTDADKKLNGNFDDHHVFQGFTDESLNVVGHPWTHVGASALWYAVSRKNQDDFSADRAKAMIAALSVTGVATMGLKAIRDNDSPNGKNWAWPSGHAASSFTVASMLDEFYGPDIGVPAYAFASLISYRMLDTGDHWTSDVVFGAALGWVVGHTFGAKHKQLEVAGFKVLPYTACAPGNNGTAVGVNLVKRF